MAGIIARNRVHRNFRYRINWLDILSEREVKEKYRLGKHRIQWLLNLIKNDISPETNRSHAIDPLTKLLVTLQFLAKGEFFSEGGLVHGISKSSLSRHIWQVLNAIDRHLNNITFPRLPGDLARLKQKFYHCRIPNCIGAIDCTLIPIVAPAIREDLFVCRKGYHAINVQAVVDKDMRFTNIVARWPGSTHDNTIFNNSGIKDWLDRGDHGWLIGDSGYALSRYMLTPKLQPTTRQEIAFNLAHSQTRMVVERSFGLLKSRFRCLHKTGGCLQFTPTKCAKIVTVCAKLHNLCIDDLAEDQIPNDGDDGADDDDELNNDDNNYVNAQNIDHNALRARAALINQF